MPPKPSIRLPTRAIPKAKVPDRPVPPFQRPPKPQSSSPKSSPSTSPWWQRGGARRSAHFAAISANVVAGLCALVFVRDHFIRLDVVRGPSMAPTLCPTVHETGDEDWVVILPYHERAPKLRHLPDGQVEVKENKGRGAALAQIKRGDVVTFWKPHKPEEISIKRVVALAGDTVYPRRGYALDPEIVRQKRLAGFDGLPEEDKDAVGGDEELKVGKVVVPYGHVWVEGDNWRKSYDSNDFGPISKGLINGRAVMIGRSLFDWRKMGDEREKRGRSLVVEGKSTVPLVFIT